MSSPQDPQQGDQPQYPPGTYGTGYGGAVYPYPQDGGTGDPATQGYPYGGGREPGVDLGKPAAPPPSGDPHLYPPSGGAPAGLEDTPARAKRPASLLVALILLIVGALPSVVAGVLVLVAPQTFSEVLFTPEVLDDPMFADAGLTPETLVGAVRTAGVFVLLLAGIYLLFAVLAFLGRNWARVLVTVMTAGFTVLQLFSLAGGGVGALVAAIPLVASVVGVVLLYRPDANAWFAALRR